MIIFRNAADIHRYVENQRNNGSKIGFVPTMGSLHEGHLSLIKKSIADKQISVCSIFVNPTQFNNAVDFQTYPQNIEEDIRLLEQASCDVLFLPSTDQIYPADFEKKHYNLGILESILEGKFRPGHFQGVCMVVEQLLNIIPCDTLYLGQKDYQQCIVIQQLIRLMNIPVKLEICSTIREDNGLAMSSRNKRLNEFEKTLAIEIYNSLIFLKMNLLKIPLQTLKDQAVSHLKNKGFEIDYVEITNTSLQTVSNWDEKSPLVGLIAVSLNNIRLIDNMAL
jgi:pantoate--beta-alanine ligase